MRLGSIRSLLLFVLLMTLVLLLPLMMGNRTPATLTASGLVLVLGGLGAWLIGFMPWPNGRPMRGLPAAWLTFAAVLTLMVLLQVLPMEPLARAFGAYPEALWQGELRPGQWSPNPNAGLRAWATFM
ncbi:MAG: hypothetical protein GW900_03080, partial [Gammaproteobacteria bacterium]|nr:hypothetical protein [Gammaproteobacteria bacterium]